MRRGMRSPAARGHAAGEKQSMHPLIAQLPGSGNIKPRAKDKICCAHRHAKRKGSRGRAGCHIRCCLAPDDGMVDVNARLTCPGKGAVAVEATD